MEEQTYPKAMIVTECTTPIWEDDLIDVVINVVDGKIRDSIGHTVADVRVGGIFSSKGVFLNSKYDWEIVRDDEDILVAVPQKKHEE